MSHVYDLPIQQPTHPARPHESTPLTFRVDGSTLFLIGEADAGTVDVIAACLDHAPSVGDVKVDLSDVTFLDVTALRVTWNSARSWLPPTGHSLSSTLRDP